MRRRDFITFLSGATTWVAAARAQEPRRVIGILGSTSYGAFPGAEAAFIQGLKNNGFLEGDNISIEWRWVEGQYNRLPSLVGELLRRNLSVIVAFDAPAACADVLRIVMSSIVCCLSGMARDKHFPIASLGKGSENRYFRPFHGGSVQRYSYSDGVRVPLAWSTGSGGLS
jgi:hypothetical protein